MTAPVTWVVTDGKAGMLSQALGLAEAVGSPIIEKTVRIAAPWRWLPPFAWPSFLPGTGPEGESLDGEPPDLLIACGRQVIGAALHVRRRSRGRTFTVYVQHPHIDPRRFDLVAAPLHDRLSGPNVIPLTGALHRVTEEKLRLARDHFAASLAHLPRPLVAVSLGGSNSVYRFTMADADRLASGLRAIVTREGGSLAVTPSRRTDTTVAARLQADLADLPMVFWDGSGENPYLGFLALADTIVVTCDSVNMISEACSTGSPVYIAPLTGSGDSKFAPFHAAMIEAGCARPFTGKFERWHYEPLNETARVAEEIRRRMAARG